MKLSTLSKPTAPELFASVRGSRDLSLVAFGAALLTAVALHLGAFLPRLEAPQARHAPELAAQPASATTTIAASQPVPCVVPKS